MVLLALGGHLAASCDPCGDSHARGGRGVDRPAVLERSAPPGVAFWLQGARGGHLVRCGHLEIGAARESDPDAATVPRDVAISVPYGRTTEECPNEDPDVARLVAERSHDHQIAVTASDERSAS